MENFWSEGFNEELFSISQAAKTSGLSRSMILRLEERGFFKPHSINTETGYRYYDCTNITQLGQYRRLREMGLSSQEIIDYYNQNFDADELLKILNRRMDLLRLTVEELNIRQNKSENLSFSILEFPEMHCYCVEKTVDSVAGAGVTAYNLFHEAVKKGYEFDYSKLIMSMRYDSDKLRRGDPTKPYRTKICIPVFPKKNSDETEFIPSHRVFSLLYRGSTDGIGDAWAILWEELKSRKLEPKGIGCSIALAAPYVGGSATYENCVIRIGIPI